MSVAQISILMSLMQATRIFGPNFWGWLADYTQRRAMILRMTALAAWVSFVGLFFAQTFTHFFIVILCINIFTSAQSPLLETLMLSEMRGDLSQYGRLRLWGSVGFIVSVVLAGQLLDRHGIVMMLWLSIFLLFFVWIASLRIQESSPAHGWHEECSLWELLARREIIAFFTSTFLMVAAHASLYVFYSLYLAQIGYSKSVIGLMWSLGVVAEIFFFFYQAPIFRRIQLQSLMLLSFVIAITRFSFIALGTHSLLLLLTAQVLHAASFGMHHSASVMTLQRWFAGPLQARGQALFISISYGLGGTFGAILLSLVWESWSAQAVYWIAALMALGGAVAANFCYRWQKN